MSYNGHKNYNAWNVSLWLNNDEGLYSQMKYYVRISITKDRAANLMFHELKDAGITHTPDGVPYSKTNIRLAMSDL